MAHEHTPDPRAWGRAVYDICLCGAVRRHSTWHGVRLDRPDPWHACSKCVPIVPNEGTD